MYSPASERTSRSYLTTKALLKTSRLAKAFIDALADFASLLLLLLAGSGTTCGRLCVRELSDETANEDLGKIDELVWLDLVVMVLVDISEHGIDVLVGDGHANVVACEEISIELAELASVEVRIAIVVVLIEVLHHILSEASLVLLESLQLSEGGIKFSFPITIQKILFLYDRVELSSLKLSLFY